MKQTTPKTNWTTFVVTDGQNVMFETERFAEAMSFWADRRSGAVYKKVVREHTPTAGPRAKKVGAV